MHERKCVVVRTTILVLKPPTKYMIRDSSTIGLEKTIIKRILVDMEVPNVLHS